MTHYLILFHYQTASTSALKAHLLAVMIANWTRAGYNFLLIPASLGRGREKALVNNHPQGDGRCPKHVKDKERSNINSQH
jgi:hypothetical protein